MAYTSLLSTSTGQMYQHQLDPIRGWWDERQLTRVVARAADAAQPTYGTEAYTPIYPGMVGFLNANNEWVFATASGTGQPNAIPLFARGGDREMDAMRYEGNMASQRAPISSAKTPTGATLSNTKDVGISCLVGSASYELGTTEFVGTPAPQALLFAAKNTQANVGKLDVISGSGFNAFYGGGSGQDKVLPIGIATGVIKNQHNLSMLYFYTCLWPTA